ncbi:hypothetical protein GCM10010174_09730 [Kutzneria viridogrisea]|uniref:Uncharacterized protein n=1 Tax=Kutzneria viridogrisea TaxID=47990 RepID=A0ABR6BXP8_9PSEU|nr:type II toxin-antitoxin system Phd/YefM family antitoxin [Kutzneria albida]MBA8931386.1 hypothetical protein [Kutzneria viridogrisea]
MKRNEGDPSALSVGEARVRLSQLLRTCREQGVEAEPVHIGARRHPEAVLLSVERFMELSMWADRGLHFRWYFEPGQDNGGQR